MSSTQMLEGETRDDLLRPAALSLSGSYAVARFLGKVIFVIQVIAY